MTTAQRNAIREMVARHQEEVSELPLESQLTIKKFMCIATGLLAQMSDKEVELSMKYLNESIEFIALQ